MTRNQAIFAAQHDWHLRTIVNKGFYPFEVGYATVLVKEIGVDLDGVETIEYKEIQSYSEMLKFAGY